MTVDNQTSFRFQRGDVVVQDTYVRIINAAATMAHSGPYTHIIIMGVPDINTYGH